MKKRMLLAALSFALGLAMFGTTQAQAQVRLGVRIGGPAYPYRAYVAPRGYIAPRYIAPRPVYGAYGPAYGWAPPVYPYGSPYSSAYIAPYGVRVVRPYGYAYPRPVYVAPRRYFRGPRFVVRLRP